MERRIILSVGTGWLNVVARYEPEAIQFDSRSCCDECAIKWHLHIGRQRFRAWCN